MSSRTIRNRRVSSSSTHCPTPFPPTSICPKLFTARSRPRKATIFLPAGCKGHTFCLVLPPPQALQDLRRSDRPRQDIGPSRRQCCLHILSNRRQDHCPRPQKLEAAPIDRSDSRCRRHGLGCGGLSLLLRFSGDPT